MLINSSALKSQLQRFADDCQGELGVCAEHIETKRRLEFNANQSFLLCSTDKVPIALCLLHQVEQGKIDLNSLYAVSAFDLRPGVSSTLTQLDYEVAPRLLIRTLLKFMLQESCNSSVDIILKLIGGPKAVMNYLAEIQIEDMRIDRTTLEALAALDGIQNLPTDQRITLAEYKILEQQVPPEQLSQAKANFKASLCDTTKPSAMKELLVKLFKQQLLNTAHTQLILKIMRGCKRGQQRLIGLLPAKTPLAHKTGTLTGYTCDVGILTLPHDYGHVAIAAYIKESQADLINNERILAEVGRTLYDYFLFQS